MGNNKSSGAVDSHGYTVEDMKKIDLSWLQDDKGFCLRYLRTTSNAEFTVGNKHMLEMKGVENCVWVEENGPLKLEMRIVLDGGAAEIRDAVLCEVLVAQGFLALQNKRKTLAMGGSDSGTCITLQIDGPTPMRKEIRHGDRFTLKESKDVQVFERISRKLIEFKDRKLQQHAVKIGIVIDKTILARFAFDDINEAQAFSISYAQQGNDVQEGTGEYIRIATLISPPDDMGSGVDPTFHIKTLYLPRNVPLRIRVSPFSLIDDNSTTSDNVLCTTSTIALTDKDSDMIFTCLAGESNELRFERQDVC